MQQVQVALQYPCPVCLNTMVPGASRSYGQDSGTRSTGKVWNLEDGPPHLVECSRCLGAGALQNRRNRRDRRDRSDRRDGLRAK